MWSWITDNSATILFGLSVMSVATVVGFLVFGPRLLARIPADYFINEEMRRERHYLDPFPGFMRPLIHVGRNVAGLLLVVVGAVLLVLPGQGLLTMLAGFILLEFPGKFACERWVVRRPQVRRSINWLRRREGKPPLILEKS